MNSEHRNNNIAIEFHVPDFQVEIDFYSQLGFEVLREEAPTSFDLGFMVLEREGARLQFYGGDDRVSKHRYFKKFPKNSPRGYEVEVVIVVSDIETLYGHARKALLDAIVTGLKKREWGSSDFRMSDPYGYYIRFTD